MTPKVLVSYSWDNDLHKKWVGDLAARMRSDGIETILDQWHLAPGTPLSQFMESAVRDNDFAINICTPQYKAKANARDGGVGYESDLMTAERLVHQKREKFIPILREGKWTDAVPTWLTGIVGFDLTGEPYSETEYRRLVDHLHGRRIGPPPVRVPSVPSGAVSPSLAPPSVQGDQTINNNGPVSNQVNAQGSVVNLNISGGVKGSSS